MKQFPGKTSGRASGKERRGAHIIGRTRWSLIVVPVALVLLLLALGDAGDAIFISDVLIWMLFASALNLLMSYGGMVSFGHAAYFGLGCYGFALAVARFDMPVAIGLLAGPALAVAGAALYGALCVRLTRVYFAMLTLACAEITYTVLFQWYDFTGGDTGITNFTEPMFGLSPNWFGVVVTAVVTLCLLLLWRVVHSPLGMAIRSVGEDPHRSAALGYNTRLVQWTAFVISGFFAGVAGTLFSVLQGNAFPGYAGLGFTLDVLVMVIVGGLHSFAGGIYGAIIYKLLDHFVGLYVEQWLLVMGVVILLVVLVSPSGAAGVIKRLTATLGLGKAVDNG